MLTRDKNGDGASVFVEAGGKLSVLNADLPLHVALYHEFAGREARIERVVGQRWRGWVASTQNDLGSHLGSSQALFTFVPAGSEVRIVSTSANDTAAGTGTRTVQLTYVHASTGAQTTKIVTMNGTTPVSCGTDIQFIQRLESWTHGATGVTQGDITVTNVGATVIYDGITAGINNSKSGKFMIPAGWSGFLINLDGTATGATMDLRVRSTVDLGNGSNTDSFHPVINGFVPSNAQIKADARSFALPGGAIVKAAAFPSAITAGVRCDVTFDILLLKDIPAE